MWQMKFQKIKIFKIPFLVLKFFISRIFQSQSGDPDDAGVADESGPAEGEHEIELGEVSIYRKNCA